MPERAKSPEQRALAKTEREAMQQAAPTHEPSPLGNQSMQSALAAGGLAALQGAQGTVGNQAVQRLAQGAAPAEADLGERIRLAAGKGQNLDGQVQRSLQEAMGADLSGVRVHTDGEADQMSRSVGALAFTTGNDIFFSQGAYNPSSQEGMRTLAHEATHVVQQAAGPVAGTQTDMGVAVSDPSDSFEQEAEANAEAVLATAAPATPAAAQTLQRAGVEEEPLQGRFVQRAGVEEEPLQGRFVQRAEEEMPLQGRFVQRAEEEMPLQGRFVQRAEEEMPLQGRFVQRAEEEEPLQGRFVQRAGVEEEPLQGRFVQRVGGEEEELLQGRFVQRAGVEEEPLQGRFVQRAEEEEALQGRFVQASLKRSAEADDDGPSAKKAKLS